MEESADKQKESALGLMEIGDEHADYLELIAGSNDNLRTGVKGVQLVPVKVGQDFEDGFLGAERGLRLVGFPLAHVEMFC